MSENKINFKTDLTSSQLLGIKEAIIVNLLSVIPSAICGFFFGTAIAGIPACIIFIYLSELQPVFLFIPIIALFLSVIIFYFSPLLLFGNYYIQNLINQCNKLGPQKGHYSQIMTVPRQFSGLRGFLEDADDIGFLNIIEKGVEFKGNNIETLIPYQHMKSIKMLTAGWRGAWCMSGRIHIVITDHPKGIGEMYFAERHAKTVLGAWKITRQIYAEIKERHNKTNPDSANASPEI